LHHENEGRERPALEAEFEGCNSPSKACYDSYTPLVVCVDRVHFLRQSCKSVHPSHFSTVNTSAKITAVVPAVLQIGARCRKRLQCTVRVSFAFKDDWIQIDVVRLDYHVLTTTSVQTYEASGRGVSHQFSLVQALLLHSDAISYGPLP